MTELLDPKVDFLFKRIFGSVENKDILIAFLNATFMNSGEPQLTAVEILNPYIDKMALDDKQSILDIHARTTDGKLVNIEIQLFNRYDMENRTLYYWSKMFSTQLSEGKPYKDLRKTIAVNIVNFSYVGNEQFHNVFHLREDQTSIVLTDLIEIHFLELPKLEQQRTTMNNKLVKWLLFLKGVQKERWEELAMNEPILRKAMDTLEFLSQDREARQLYEMRQKALHDEVSMIEGAKEEKAMEVANNLLKMGLSIDMIMQATGLQRQVIEKLRDPIH